MDAIDLLREAFDRAYNALTLATADVTAAQAAWQPPGTANPLGGVYAHVITTHDFFVQRVLQGQPMLAESSWAGRTGVSEPQPPPGTPAYGAWVRRVQVDLPVLRTYAAAVQAATAQYLAGLHPADLDGTVDMTALGMPPMPRTEILLRPLLGHLDTHTGEIMCLKGLQATNKT